MLSLVVAQSRHVNPVFGGGGKEGEIYLSHTYISNIKLIYRVNIKSNLL